MKLHRFSMTLFPIFLLSPSLKAAPAPTNTLTQILEKSCSDGSCVEGYKVKFRQISFEGSKEQATASVTLLPNQGIDYPILGDEFEAQLVQGTFAGICKIKRVPSIESIRVGDGIEINPEFRDRLRSCLMALTERTEKALGR